MSDVLQGSGGREALASGGESQLRTYRLPKGADLLLACGRCQRKLKGEKGSKAVSKLKRTVKRVARGYPDSPAVRVVTVSCLKLCPKGAVTVCTGRQAARRECSVVRTAADVEVLFREIAG